MSATASPALIFIPDISGFTRFVNETEVAHSQLIIQELLETLIDSDTLGMKVSEIEGDAILFYRNGAPPEPEALVRQAEQMFLAFHRCLMANEHRRICPCNACQGAARLTLKFIVHQGHVSTIRIKDREKLFGADVILAHRLLKNQVPGSEYLLGTEPVRLNSLKAGAAYPWLSLHSGSERYDAGEVAYHFATLEPLRSQVTVPAPAAWPRVRSARPLRFERRLGAAPTTLFPLLSDVAGRTRFIPDAQSIRIEDARHNHIIRQGMIYETVVNGRASRTVVSEAQVMPDRVVLAESALDKPITTEWTVEPDGQGSRITLAIHTAFKGLDHLLFVLFGRRRLEARIDRMLANIQRIADEATKTA